MPAGPGEQTPRSALRVWVPVVVAALVQLATTGAVLGAHSAASRLPRGGPAFGGSAFGGSAANPLRELGAHPLPPWVAVVLLVLALAGPALLTVIHRATTPVLGAITAAAVAGTVLCATQGSGAPFYLSVLFGVAAAVLRRVRIAAWSCAGAYWLAFALAYLISGQVLQLGWLVPLTLLSVAALVGPEFGRSRREARARALRELEARRVEEAQAERVRIARELHDVLAHSLSQINVQASVGLHLFDAQPEKAAEALTNVKETSGQALDEVRQVLGMLRGDEVPLAPGHGLDGLAALVGGVRAQGVEAVLRYEVPDASRVPAAVQQAAYRIVQEALTNVAKHARARRVRVDVAEAKGEGGRLLVTISDDGVGAASAPSSDGRGLLGMRERAELLGGVFSAGARADRGFEVRAELPLGGIP